MGGGIIVQRNCAALPPNSWLCIDLHYLCNFITVSLTGPATPRQMKHLNATENLSTLIKICVSSLLLFRFSTIYLLRLIQFHHLFFFSVQFFCHAQKAPLKINKIHFKKYFWKTIQIFVGLFVYSFSWAVTSIEAFDCNSRRVHWKWVRNKPQRLMTGDRRHQGIVSLFVQMSWPSPDTSSIYYLSSSSQLYDCDYAQHFWSAPD